MSKFKVMLGALMMLAILVGSMPATAHAIGPCYTLTVHTGEPEPPSVTVCPLDR